MQFCKICKLAYNVAVKLENEEEYEKHMKITPPVNKRKQRDISHDESVIRVYEILSGMSAEQRIKKYKIEDVDKIVAMLTKFDEEKVEEEPATMEHAIIEENMFALLKKWHTNIFKGRNPNHKIISLFCEEYYNCFGVMLDVESYTDVSIIITDFNESNRKKTKKNYERMSDWMNAYKQISKRYV